MPRMPRSGKEVRKQLVIIEELIQNPTNRCLAVIYVNIAIFVIGYIILFTYNIYCYFRYRRAWAAEANGHAIFKLNHPIADSNSPQNLQYTVRKAAIAAAKRDFVKLSVSLTETILEEEEMIKGEAAEERMKLVPYKICFHISNRTEFHSTDLIISLTSEANNTVNTVKFGSIRYMERVNPEISAKRELLMIDDATSLEKISKLEERISSEISAKRELSVINGATSLEKISELEESFSVPDLFDESDETSTSSLMRTKERNSPSRFLSSNKEAENFLRSDEHYDCNNSQFGNSSKLHSAGCRGGMLQPEI
ncbi:unnamed protein product [Cercopithifilaria johnstoni]|uniref:Uncharacterized protein n=1 Tax=Cercopithifilaria johnstoni TaxID=2874296 RepID=A0A8J2LX32_9BILA|nr:unnamed protein product [Cercopithifilaria johnstoni]